MARRKLRQIRFESKRKLRNKPRRVKTKATAASSRVAPAASPAAAMTSAQSSSSVSMHPAIFTRQDLVSKLIPLSVPSAKDAQKNAHKTIDNVFSAIRHVLSEGDLAVADFGELKAAKSGKTGDIQIRFIPDEKLKRAVEARLNAAS